MKDSLIPKPRTDVFGQYLRKIRDRAARSQMQLADQLVSMVGTQDVDAEKARKNWQSFLARLELGSGSVRPEHLPLLAKAYVEPLERMATAYLATHVFLDAPIPKYLDEAPVKRLDWSGPASFFVSNSVEAWSLDEIKEWERGIVGSTRPGVRPELWIVSPEFVDHKDDDFLKVVVDDLLLKHADLTYFVAERDIPAGQDFDWFLDRVAMRLQNRFRDNGMQLLESSVGSISVYGLTPEELTWFTSSLVIANPKEFQGGTDGVSAFMIVPVDGTHTLGIPVHPRELSGIVSAINRQISIRERKNSKIDRIDPDSAVENKPTYDRNALKNKLFR